MKVKILHVVGSMNQGGIETLLMRIFRNINRDKFQFDFLVHSQEKQTYEEEIKKLGGKIFYVPPRSQGLLVNKKSLNYFFSKNNNYDVVHQHVSSLSYIEPLIYAKKHGISTRVIHGHSVREGGSKLHYLLHYLNRIKIDKIATDYFGCSTEVNDWMYGGNNSAFTKSRIMKNGLEISNFIYDKELEKKIRLELGVQDKFVIGHVGRISYPKNHEFLIEVFNDIYIKHQDSILLLVGEGSNEKIIFQKIRQYGLEDQVIRIPSTNQVSDYLHIMDAFVFPSFYEGFPLSLVEAQTMGITCFISDTITDDILLTDHIYKLSLLEGPEEWANRVLSSYFNRKDSKEIRYHNNVLKIKEQGFDIMSVVQDMEKLYESR